MIYHYTLFGIDVFGARLPIRHAPFRGRISALDGREVGSLATVDRWEYPLFYDTNDRPDQSLRWDSS